MRSSPILQFRTFPPKILHHSSALFLRDRRRRKSNRRAKLFIPPWGADRKPHQGRQAEASLMLIKNLEKLRKKTLRERIYEEVVRLIVSGELPSGEWVDEKQVIGTLRVSRTPFREAIGTLAKGGLIEIKPYRGFYFRSFSRNETADLYELYKQLQCFAVELAVPHMSDRDIRRYENMLDEAVAALRRGDMTTYAMRDRKFYETIARRSGNAAL